ncbi:hypothetical protein [Mycolicibacterium septicum]|nr:hypothetical protein [Mycolicibacterium septicum]
MRTSNAEPGDTIAWSTATWSSPFTTQGVLALMFVAQWLLGQLAVFPERERAWFLAGLAISVIVSLTVGAMLLTRQSARIRGVALSILGSSVVVLTGGIIFSVWMM